MSTIGGTLATAGDVRKEQAEQRVIERRRRLEKLDDERQELEQQLHVSRRTA